MAVENAAKLSKVCVDLCKGACCDPWWGIIYYTLEKDRGLAGLNDFKKTVALSIAKRVERIKSRYMTNEDPPRRLFKDPERYNVAIENITPAPGANGALLIHIRAMFAFRCVFLSPDKKCAIHPSILSFDIRPPHCAELGAPGIKPGEKGYCRIIAAAISSGGNDGEIMKAIELERKTSERHYNEGCRSSGEAAEKIIVAMRGLSHEKALGQMPREKADTPGRNDPCFCGSGVKYKKCHGG